MLSIKKLEQLISDSEDTLLKYQEELVKNPNSLFAIGVVKNTMERLVELKNDLASDSINHSSSYTSTNTNLN